MKIFAFAIMFFLLLLLFSLNQKKKKTVQFSKTAHFSDQKISNIWSKKSIMEENTQKCPLFQWISLKTDYISSTYKVKPHATKKTNSSKMTLTNIIVWRYCSQKTFFILRLLLHTFNDFITIDWHLIKC